MDGFTGITYHYKYDICLDDIFNFFGEIFAIFFLSLFCFYYFMRKGLLLSRKGARGKGNGLIIINMKYV